jgi:hypothetical protein
MKTDVLLILMSARYREIDPATVRRAVDQALRAPARRGEERERERGLRRTTPLTQLEPFSAHNSL